MTEIQILEGNKLIAQFMGKDDEHRFLFDHLNTKALYHISWDWIMPVIEKIKELKHPVYIYESHIQNTVEIFRLNDSSSYIIRKSSTKEKPIDLVWSAVVEFIEWYNENKSK